MAGTGGYGGAAVKPAVIDLNAEAVDDFKDIVDSPGGCRDVHLALVGDGDDVDNLESEFIIDGTGGSDEDSAFDNTVGVLQEIVLDESFQNILQGFCKEHCHHFEDTEENKLVYTELFEKYSGLIEGVLEEKLGKALPGFSMGEFLEELVKRGEEEVDCAVFDLLLSLADFDAFKASMIAEKAALEPSGGLTVAGKASRIHQDEDSEGEERPDLMDLMMISSSPKGKRP